MNLSGKKAIVTGASKGIGYATIVALLEKGVTVAGWSRTSPSIKHENFHYFAADVGDVESVNRAYNNTIKEIGEDIHILVNNAGIGYSGLLEEMPVDEWEEMFKVNVHGLFYCSQMVIPSMKEMGEGHIINVASVAGTTGVKLLSGYCGTKFAVRGITQSMFQELRGYGIKVTSLVPGSVQTQFFDNVEHMEVSEHMMKADEVAEGILYLLQTSSNFLPVEYQMRPLKPKG